MFSAAAVASSCRRQSLQSSKCDSNIVCSLSLNFCSRNNSIRFGSHVIRSLFTVLAPALFFLLVFSHLILDSPENAAARCINRARILRERLGHGLNGTPFDSGQPKCLPRGLMELLANLPCRPAKHFAPVLQA